MVEEATGDWMMDFEKDEMVRQRIACDDRDYPASEALYQSVEEWEQAHNMNWVDYIVRIL